MWPPPRQHSLRNDEGICRQKTDLLCPTPRLSFLPLGINSAYYGEHAASSELPHTQLQAPHIDRKNGAVRTYAT